MATKKIVSWAYVKENLGLDDSQEAVATNLVDSVSAMAERIAGRELGLESRTIQVDGHGSSFIFLPVSPITTISSLLIDRSREFGADATAIAPADYYVFSRSAMIERLNDRWPKGKKIIQVVYTAGYDTDAFPADVEKACLECIQSWLTKNNDRAWGYRSMTQSNGTNITYDFDLTLLGRQAFESLRLEGVPC